MDSLPDSMRAVVQRAYGSPDTLTVADVDRPRIGERDVLVRVRAAAVHRGDVHLVRGLPYVVRLLGYGLRRPRRQVPGQCAAGTVVAVGAGVGGFRAGERVFGTFTGAWAEFANASVDAVAPLPADVSFELGAGVPHGGLAALQALRDAGRLEAGQQVLVIGASGAVGTMAVRIGKLLGAHVTGVCRTAHVERVRALGADTVVDDTHEDFAGGATRYDVVVDLVGARPLGTLRRVLAPRGRAVMVSGGRGRWLGGLERVIGGALGSLATSRKIVPFVARPSGADLPWLAERIEAGAIVPVVERTFPLEGIGDALRRVESGHAHGTVVVAP